MCVLCPPAIRSPPPLNPQPSSLAHSPPAGPSSPVFGSLVSDCSPHFVPNQGGDSGDAVITVPSARPLPRQEPVQPGSELHRQLSDPALLASAARQLQQQQQQQQQQ